MKKLIYIFTVFISIFIFYNSFKQNSMIEKERIENVFNGVENKEVTLIDVSLRDDRHRFYDDLISFVEENEETAFISLSDQDQDMIKYNSVFLYSKNVDILKNNKIFLEKNRTIDFSNPTDEYFSTDLEEPSFDHIVFLDRKLNKKYNEIYKFYQFEEIRKVDNVDYYYVFFITDDSNQLKEKIRNSVLSKYLNDIPDNERFDYTKFDTSFFNKLLLICIITILLLIICDILKRKKEIMIRKLNGMSNLYIAFKVYYKQFLISSFLYFITFIICYCIWIGRIHEVAYEFIQIQLQYFGLFVLLNMVVWFLIYLMIRLMKSVNEMKKPAYLRVISIFDIILKVVILLLLINPLIEYTRLGIYEVSNFYFILSNKETLRNQIYVDGIMENNKYELGYLSNFIQDYMHKKGAIYQDFISKEKVDENNKKIYEFSYIRVNTNYMKDYEVVHAETNEVLDITNIQKAILLIPEKYKDEEMDTSLYSDYNDCDIIYVKNGQKYLNHDPATATDYGWYMKDPIVFVEDRIDNWCHPFVFLSYENMDEVNQMKKDLQKAGFENNYIFNTINKRYDIIFEQIKDSCLEVLFIMVVYAIVVCVFLYQSIFIYFIENKEKCALKYIHGYSFMERHGEMLLMNISIYIIPLLVGWFYYHIPLVELLLVVGIAIIFEIISMWIITRIFEKNKIIEILKGE